MFAQLRQLKFLHSHFTMWLVQFPTTQNLYRLKSAKELFSSKLWQLMFLISKPFATVHWLTQIQQNCQFHFIMTPMIFMFLRKIRQSLKLNIFKMRYLSMKCRWRSSMVKFISWITFSPLSSTMTSLCLKKKKKLHLWILQKKASINLLCPT